MSSDAGEVAKEAAYLLYSKTVGEYAQAKRLAAANLGIKTLPSNFDVAMELDAVADECEGQSRGERLVAMRKAALETMRALGDACPRLIGSVWRGTANTNSDIDIVVYSEDPKAIQLELNKAGAQIVAVQDENYDEQNKRSGSTHIHATLKPSWNLEVIVRPVEELGKSEFCDIFGDRKTGLGLKELAKVLAEAPERRFVPTRRVRRK